MSLNSKKFKEQLLYFAPAEFPEWIGYGHPKLFYSLDEYRALLGCRIYPSPAPGALARFDWNDRKSQHYAEKEGLALSKAVDVFPDCSIQIAFLQALTSQLWGGVGVYFDTEYNGESWPMLHLDIRNPGAFTAIWFRINKHDYRSPQFNKRDRALFFNLLNQEG